MKDFVGRFDELDQFRDVARKKSASFITLQGRRRIGKSSLVKHFCTTEKIPFFEFLGLPPRPRQSRKEQLATFATTLSRYLGAKRIEVNDWPEAFEQLHLLCLKLNSEKSKYLILLDEISWMSSWDPDFAGHLKEAWDRYFCHHSKLILVVCGSVSSWIENNILRSTGFVGRVTREFHLPELTIPEAADLLRRSTPKLSAREIARILAVVGGVPKYLEEFAPYKTVEVGIQELCFHPNGFLFREFEAIFADIFGKKSLLYANILRALILGPLTPAELAEKMGLPLNRDFSEIIRSLELAGFIRRDFSWHFSGKPSRISQLRIRDNYTKFFLKYIEPQRQKLTKVHHRRDNLSSHLPWATILGLQFENLILNNINLLVGLANIPLTEIVQIGPYYQTATKSQTAVQIDCVVQCKKGLLHLFEFKTGEKIGLDVEKNLRRSSAQLKIPRGFSLRHYLVYTGELTTELADSDFFDRKISFDDFLR